VKEWKKRLTKLMAPKTEGAAVFITDKVDFKPQLVRRDKGGHFILIKGARKQEEVTIVNLYAPNVSTSNFNKHIKNTDRLQHSGSGRLKYSSIINK
jgi:hypothetical protein